MPFQVLPCDAGFSSEMNDSTELAFCPCGHYRVDLSGPAEHEYHFLEPCQTLNLLVHSSNEIFTSRHAPTLVGKNPSPTHI